MSQELQPALRRAKRGSKDIRIETMRGIACLLLVSMHVIGHNSTAGIRVPDDSAYRWFVESFMYLRMPLFSFLAGYVYAVRPLTATGAYAGFMGKKARRLLIPYLIFVPMIGLAQSIVPDANNPTALAWYEWFIYPLSPYWFLIATFWVFALVTFVDSKGWLKSRNVVLGIIAAAAIVDVIVPPQDRTYELLGLRSGLFLLTFFLVGLAAKRFQWADARPGARLSVIAAAVVLAAVTQLGLAEVLPRVRNRHEVIGTLLGITACLALLWLNLRVKILVTIGAYSAGIFLVHPFLIAGARAVLSRFGVQSDELLFVIGMTAGIAGAILIVKLARKVPFGRFALGESWVPKRADVTHAPGGRHAMSSNGMR